MRYILGDLGANYRGIFIVGDRPDSTEYEDRSPFVGNAGAELWSRLSRCARLYREQVYATYLVKTFSTSPPSRDEILRDEGTLRRELRTHSPWLVVTVGYYAARWFLPQFADVRGDYFHGLCFADPSDSRRLVVPLVHSAAALRQPDLYQAQFTADCRALGRVLADDDGRTGESRTHIARTLSPYRVGLAGFGKADQRLGVDTEGTVADPQAVQIAANDREAACIELNPGQSRPQFLKPAIESASRIYLHHDPYDRNILWQLGIRDLPRTDDTMLMAYLLHLPQSLKVLAWREIGVQMREYSDIVEPVDHANVSRVLEAAYAEGLQIVEAEKEAEKQWRKRCAARRRERKKAEAHNRRRDSGDTRRSTAGATRERDATGIRRAAGSCAAEGARERSSPKVSPEVAPYSSDRASRSQGADRAAPPSREWTGRALSSLARLLGKPRRSARTGSQAEAALEAEAQEVAADDAPPKQSLRTRWERSAFHLLVPLPPPATWRDAPTSERIQYALTDPLVTRMIGERLLPRLRSEGLERAYHADRGVLPFLARNTFIGLRVDERELNRLSSQFRREFDETCAKINELAGRDVNPLASEDISDVLFDDWGVTPTRYTKTGFLTTQDKYLKARKSEHAGVPLVIEARQINKMLGTYTEKLPSLLHNGRYHPDWKYTRTASSRMAEQIILLIPKHTARGKAIRKAFLAEDGCELVAVDLSQIEMRVMAHESRDKLFLHAYRTGIDMHAQTAHNLLGAPKRKEDQDESLHRLPAKTINFGILMGMTEYGLLDQLHEQGQLQWNIDSVREFREEWFKLYPGVEAYVESRKREARKHGYVTTMWGGKIDVSGIWSTDDRIRAEFERKAHAIPIQEGAIRLAKLWVRRVWRDTILPRIQAERRYCEPFVWMHDDITLCVDRRIAKTVRAEVLAAVPDLLCVPTTADAKTGENWGELH